jgi:diguanylate cyclase (GGDEF)-like protein
MWWASRACQNARVTGQHIDDRDRDDAAATAALLAQCEAARRSGRIDEAVATAERALARAGDDDLLAALAQLELGNVLRYVPETVRALQLLSACERTLRARNHKSLPRALTLKGMALGDAGDNAAALDLYRDALRLLEQAACEPDPMQEAVCFGAIGVACTQLADFAEAESAYGRAIALYEAMSVGESVAYLYNNLAILRVRSIQALADRASPEAQALGREMQDFVQRGLAINRDATNNPHAGALLSNTLGDGLRALGRADEALPTLQAALQTYRAMRNTRGVVDAATDLAAALLDLERVDDALDLLVETHASLRDVALKDHELRVLELLAQAHERRGDTAAALGHMKAFHRLYVEIQDAEAKRNVQRIALRAEIDKAMRESREDALTGISNRRRFEEQLQSEAAVPPSGFAVLVFDIDHFKQVNDRFSHAAGDAVLRDVGRILREHCRGSDFVARIGGEEFVQFLHGVTSQDANAAGERLRAAIERHPWSAIDPGLAVTVSIGVAASDGAASLTTLIRTADERLYTAKRGGRNRVVAEH